MAQTGMNPYAYGAQVLDSAPYVKFFLEKQAKDQAKADAIDKYYRERLNDINDKGLRGEERKVINQIAQDRKNWYMNPQNRERLKRGDIDATSEFESFGKMMGEVAGEGLMATENEKRGFDVFKQAPYGLDEESLSILESSKNPIFVYKNGTIERNPAYKSIDPYKLKEKAKPFAEEDETKILGSVKVEPKELGVSQLPSKERGADYIETYTKIGFDPKDIQNFESQVAGVVKSNERFADFAREKFYKNPKMNEYLAAAKASNPTATQEELEPLAIGKMYAEKRGLYTSPELKWRGTEMTEAAKKRERLSEKKEMASFTDALIRGRRELDETGDISDENIVFNFLGGAEMGKGLEYTTGTTGSRDRTKIAKINQGLATKPDGTPYNGLIKINAKDVPSEMINILKYTGYIPKDRTYIPEFKFTFKDGRVQSVSNDLIGTLDAVSMKNAQKRYIKSFAKGERPSFNVNEGQQQKSVKEQPKSVRYSVDGKIYNIPLNESGEFLKAFPKAKKL